MKRNKAFTLAEVLITLTILGVVAAIAIPNMIQAYQKRVFMTRFKTAYSMINKLVDISFATYGYPKEYAAASQTFEYFRPFLEISKECGTGTGKYEKSGCFSGPSPSGDKQKGWYLLKNTVYNSGEYDSNWYYKVLLKNNMGLALWDSSINGKTRIIFLIDIDGPNKGFSKIGQDTFMFTYNKVGKGYTLIPGGTTGGWGCQYNNRSNSLKCCKENTSGFTCSALIVFDGFKISKDYPWDYANKKPE